MSLIDNIFNAGIVGCGGAGFPTHAKLNCSVEYFIINGAECEPLLRTDRYLMINKAKEVVLATSECAKYLGAKETYIALKETYKKEAEALQKAIEELGADIKLFYLQNYYPAGDEQMIVHEVTKRVVPPSGIPLDVGTVVSNVATMFCVSEAIDNKPFTHKYLTVTGEVKTPTVLCVPVGTSILKCIEQAGGAIIDECSVINGGPLMGRLINDDDLKTAVVTKTTSGILVLPKTCGAVTQKSISYEHIKNRAKSACIQCSYCTQLCPRYLSGHPLEPHKIMRRTAMSNDFSELLDDEIIKQALICCECGACEVYACPMGLSPKIINKMIKAEYQKQGIRYEKPQEDFIPRDERENRKIYSKRIAARAGVLKYYDYNIENCISFEPDCIVLKLSQHIGALCEPVVKIKDKVSKGQLVAKCPDSKLGANLHTGISGVVISVTDSEIVIKGGAN